MSTASLSAPAVSGRSAAAAPRGPRRRLGQWAFVIPALLYMVLFFGYPLVNNIIMSFQQYTPSTFFTGESPFTGFDNWRRVLTDATFQSSLGHTLLFTVGSLTGQFGLGLLLATFFQRHFPLSGLVRALLLLPWLVPMVVSGIVWRRLMDVDAGVLNSLLGLVGIDGVPWLASPDVALLSVTLVNIWIGIPFNMVILYGGLQEVPRDLYEAASLDGAGRFRTFWSITLPMIRPVVTVVLVLGFMSTIKVLDLVLGLTDGGPAGSTETLGTQTYRYSFAQLDFGSGAVVGNVLILISMVFALVYLRANRADGGTR